MQISIGMSLTNSQRGAAGTASVLVSRFYFSAAQTPDISPAYGAWEDASGSARRKLLSAKEVGESLAGLSSESEAELWAVRQFISAPLVAQTISGTVKCYTLARDVGGGGMTVPLLSVRILSGDGLTVRGTLLAIANYGTGFLHSSLRNKAFADGDAMTEVVAQDGDVLVVETGFNNGGFDTAQLLYGAPSATADLPENQTGTTSLVPWIEFSNGILLQD